MTGIGRRDSRTSDFEMQIITEETEYLLSLGCDPKVKRYIMSGIKIAKKTFAPEDWINISDETLRWHCSNFYKIGYNHATAKTYKNRNNH